MEPLPSSDETYKMISRIKRHSKVKPGKHMEISNQSTKSRKVENENYKK